MSSPAPHAPRAALALVGAGIFIADQVSKWLTRQHLEQGESREVLGTFFQLQHIHNRGIAFGLFSGMGGAVVFLALLVGVVLLLAMTKLGSTDRLVAFGIACLAAGASGNIVDRLNQGYVTDMLQLPGWPTFNVADIGICVGVGLVLLSNLLSMRATARNHDDSVTDTKRSDTHED